MQVKRRYNLVEISYSWFRLSNIFITVLAVGVSYGGGFFADIPLLIRLCLAVILTYIAIAGWINKTRIRITDKHISVSHSPLHWMGAKVVDTCGITRLYSQKKEFVSTNGYSIFFAVFAVPENGEDIKLVGGFTEKQQALFVQQEIEKYLGIDTEDWLVRKMLE